MGALGSRDFVIEMVTASASLSNCQRNHGGNYGSFFYILKDSTGTNTTDESLVTDSRITYTFPSAFSIHEMTIRSESTNVSTGNLYVILAPNDPDINREFITHIPLNMIDKDPYSVRFRDPIYMVDVSDKLKLRFIFKGHPQGAQFKYWVDVSGEEYELT